MSRTSLLRAVTLAAVVGVALVARLPDFPVAVAGVIWAVAAWRLLRGSDGRGLVPRRIRLALDAGAVLFGVVLLQRLAAGTPAPLIALLVLLALVQALALLRPQSAFTAFLVLLFSTIHAAGAAFLAHDVLALALTATYLALLATALVLFERDAAHRKPQRDRGAVRRLRMGSTTTLPRGAVFRAVGGLVLAGFVGGSLLYLVVPRGMFSGGEEDETQASVLMGPGSEEDTAFRMESAESFAAGSGAGSSKGIRLGDIGTIKKDLTPFFEVLMPAGRKPWLREDSFDVYARGDWTASSGPETRAVQSMHPGIGGWMDLGREEDPIRGYNVRIGVYRGPQRRLYLERDAVRVRVMRRGRALPTILRRADNEQVESFLSLEVGDIIEERAVPPVSDPNALESARSDAAASPRASYLEFPAYCEPIRELAQRVVGAETNAWRRARRIEAFLEGDDYTYTLKMPVVDRTRPVVDFLLNKRHGHCEYFAASMALMLRSLGHPTRVVRGFRGGDWLEDRGTWMIRAMHYHLWCEMYFAGLGWIPIDPTPPDRQAADADRSRTRVAGPSEGEGEGPDLAAQFLDYGNEERAALEAAVGRFAERVIVRPLAFVFGPDGYFVGFLGLGLALLWLTRRRHLTRVARAVGVPRRELPSGTYGRALEILAKRGFRRRPPQTAGEFEEVVSRLLPGAAVPLGRITRLYERRRFGGREPDRDAVRRAREAVATLEEAAKRIRARR